METKLKRLNDRKRLFLPFVDLDFRRASYSNVIESLIRVSEPKEGLLSTKLFSELDTWDIALKSSVWVDKDTGKLEILEHDRLWDFLTEIKQSSEESWFAVFFGTKDKSENIPHVFSTKSIVGGDKDNFQYEVSFVGEEWSLVIRLVPPLYDDTRLITPGGDIILLVEVVGLLMQF